jgi:hypothetical protein
MLGISPRTLTYHAEQETVPCLRLGKHCPGSVFCSLGPSRRKPRKATHDQVRPLGKTNLRSRLNQR